jgi:hypothetical protein
MNKSPPHRSGFGVFIPIRAFAVLEKLRFRRLEDRELPPLSEFGGPEQVDVPKEIVYEVFREIQHDSEKRLATTREYLQQWVQSVERKRIRREENKS